MAHRWLPLIYLTVLGAIWGMHFSFIKLAAESGLSYLGVAAATTTGVAIMMLLVALIRRRLPRFDITHLRFYLVCALLGYVAPFIIELNSAAHLPASVLALVVSSSPLFTVALAIAFRSDTISLRRMLGIIVGTMSAALILGPAALGLTDIPAFWVLVAFSVPLIYAADHNYISKFWPERSDSYQLGCGEALLAFAIFAPLYLWQGVLGDMDVAFGPGHIAIIVMIFFSIIEIFLYFEIVRLAGPIFVSQTNFVTVVTGVIWAMIIFGERPSKWLWLSAALLAVALYFVAATDRRGDTTQKPS